MNQSKWTFIPLLAAVVAVTWWLQTPALDATISDEVFANPVVESYVAPADTTQEPPAYRQPKIMAGQALPPAITVRAEVRPSEQIEQSERADTPVDAEKFTNVKIASSRVPSIILNSTKNNQ